MFQIKISNRVSAYFNIASDHQVAMFYKATGIIGGKMHPENRSKMPREVVVRVKLSWIVSFTTFSRCRVTAEVKHNSTNTIVCKAQGEWNGTLEFTYSSGETKVIDTDKLPVTKKKLRPVERQGRTESRWTLSIFSEGAGAADVEEQF